MKEYFPHDFNARTDPKLQNVMMELGVAGIGTYWCIVEQLYEQGGRLPLTDIPAIAFTLHVETQMVQKLLSDFGLFHSDAECFWSTSIARRVQKREEVHNTYVEKGKLGAAKRWNKNSPAIAQLIEQNSSTIAIKEKESKDTSSEYREKETTTATLPLVNSLEKDKEKRTLRGSKKEREKTEPCPALSALPADPQSDRNERVDWEALRAFFNRTVKDKLPQVSEMTEGRRAAVRARMTKHGKRAVFEVIQKAAASTFLLGDNDRNWRADFDWIFKPTNFAKILEGSYDNRQSNHHNGINNQKYGGRRGYTDVTATCPEDYTKSSL